MAAEKDSEFRKSELLTLFAQYVELPAEIKIQHLKSLIEKDNFEIFEDDDDQKKTNIKIRISAHEIPLPSFQYQCTFFRISSEVKGPQAENLPPKIQALLSSH